MIFHVIATFAALELLVTAVTYFSAAYTQALFHIDVWYSLLVVLMVLLAGYWNKLALLAFLTCVGELILVSIAVALHGYQGVQLLDLIFSAILTLLSLVRIGVGHLFAIRSRA